MGKEASYTHFYEVVCMNNDIGGANHEYIRDICLFLSRSEELRWRNNKDFDNDKEIFDRVANVLYSLEQTSPDKLNNNMRQALACFKRGMHSPVEISKKDLGSDIFDE